MIKETQAASLSTFYKWMFHSMVEVIRHPASPFDF